AVGAADIIVSADGESELRYASIFGRWLLGRETSLTVRHTERAAGNADFEGALPAPAPLGDESLGGRLSVGSGSTFAELQHGRYTLTYGGITPESWRRNRFAGRTEPLTGYKLVVRGDAAGGGRTGAEALSAYHGAVYGRDHFDLFEDLGVTGPYYLSRAPVVPGSVQVWLVTRARDGSGRELRRVRLIEGADFELWAGEGVLWLKTAPAGVDDQFNPVVLEVAYRTVEEGVVGQVTGLRLDLQPGGIRLGVSASSERRDGSGSGPMEHQVLGVDGTIRLGTAGSVSFEAGTSVVSDVFGPRSGAGLHVAADAAVTERLRLEAAATWVEGRLRAPGRREEPPGLRLAVGLKYRLGENTELMFKHGLEEPVAAPASRSGGLLWSSGSGTGWRLRAGVASSRSEAGDEATRIHAGLGWSVGERHRFSLDAGVEARGPAAAAGAPGTDGWTIVAPAQVAYQLTSPHARAGLAYRQALGAHGPGRS